MASVASQLIQEVTAHVQSDSLEDARQICADGTYFPNHQPTYKDTIKSKPLCPRQYFEFEAGHHWTYNVRLEDKI